MTWVSASFYLYIFPLIILAGFFPLLLGKIPLKDCLIALIIHLTLLSRAPCISILMTSLCIIYPWVYWGPTTGRATSLITKGDIVSLRRAPGYGMPKCCLLILKKIALWSITVWDLSSVPRDELNLLKHSQPLQKVCVPMSKKSLSAQETQWIYCPIHKSKSQSCPQPPIIFTLKINQL